MHGKEQVYTSSLGQGTGERGTGYLPAVRGVDAAYENSPEAKAVAWVVFIIAETLLILVFVRTMYHWAQVARGRALWRDPLAPASAWVDEKTGGRVGHCEGDDAAITPA